MIFGTDGHRAAGTSENETPNVTMSMRASVLLGNAGRTHAKPRWQTIMMIAPSISIEAPLPLKSRNAPRNGVRTIARIGKQLNSLEAASALMSNVSSR